MASPSHVVPPQSPTYCASVCWGKCPLWQPDPVPSSGPCYARQAAVCAAKCGGQGNPCFDSCVVDPMQAPAVCQPNLNAYACQLGKLSGQGPDSFLHMARWKTDPLPEGLYRCVMAATSYDQARACAQGGVGGVEGDDQGGVPALWVRPLVLGVLALILLCLLLRRRRGY